MIQAILDHFSIKSQVTTSYKPNANGLAERTNYTLCMMLAKDADMDGSKQNWDKRLHAILWEYRTTWKTSTGYSPFRMVYGVESKLPIQFDLTTFMTIQQRLKKSNGAEAIKSYQQQLIELEEAQALAMIRVERAKQLQKSITTNEVKTVVATETFCFRRVAWDLHAPKNSLTDHSSVLGDKERTG
ncbi:hypothetical protein AXG93_3954s1030 [Marchantia polymorpha subsp. ruderalis]|uniref:Integrase catalytic domain-containing protein n=1 Tax=Marchantia polymorpha subsp. ruderalis TaxID=1480154 RepID=A0A176VLW6_MARPO|nr:hypothetical protein AXG93_3954s1030 [Marchantia polymorpha subsp. ruderalis]